MIHGFIYFLKFTFKYFFTGRERKSSSSTPINDLPISPDNQEIYKQLISGARNLVEEGKILDALELNKQALQIYPNEKLEKKIAKMEVSYVL